MMLLRSSGNRHPRPEHAAPPAPPEHEGMHAPAGSDEPLPGEQPRQEEPPAGCDREAPLTTPEDTLGG